MPTTHFESKINFAERRKSIFLKIKL